MKGTQCIEFLLGYLVVKVDESVPVTCHSPEQCTVLLRQYTLMGKFICDLFIFGRSQCKSL
jgi:hypothetical protein